MVFVRGSLPNRFGGDTNHFSRFSKSFDLFAECFLSIWSTLVATRFEWSLWISARSLNPYSPRHMSERQPQVSHNRRTVTVVMYAVSSKMRRIYLHLRSVVMLNMRNAIQLSKNRRMYICHFRSYSVIPSMMDNRSVNCLPFNSIRFDTRFPCD